MAAVKTNPAPSPEALRRHPAFWVGIGARAVLWAVFAYALYLAVYFTPQVAVFRYVGF